ncbi:hypothetical protein B0G74_0762 [Paraburkholderia sp. BL9I2N2]|nr:hypothetical protein B0G74_0762 [Paraburkholderia sp. BL9I2N2]
MRIVINDLGKGYVSAENAPPACVRKRHATWGAGFNNSDSS